jgi:hypothetical protein
MYRLQAISWAAAAGVASAILKHMVAVARPISDRRSRKRSCYRYLLWRRQRPIRPLIFYAFEQPIKPEGIPYSDDVARGIMIEPESNMEIDLLSWTQAIYSS